MKILNRVCHHLYVMSLIVAAAILVLAPWHLMSTVELPIVDTLPNGRIRFVPEPGKAPAAGTEIHYFRFHGDWTLPVGRLRVLGNHPDGGVIAQAVDPSFRFPLGIQGSVVWESEDRHQLRINVGTDVGITEKMRIDLFDLKHYRGQARVLRVHDGEAELVYPGRTNRSLLGAQASIYSVPNSVSYLANPVLEKLEWVVGFLIVALFILRGVAPRIWTRVVDRTRWLFATLARPRRFWMFLFAPLMLYYLVRFLLRSWDHVVVTLGRSLQQTWLFTFAIGERSLLLPAVAAAAIAFLWVFVETGRSPWKVLREKTQFHPPPFDGRIARTIAKVGFDRSLVVWLLQVIVVYAFAHTLVGVLAANLRVAAALAFPQITTDFTSTRSTLATLRAFLSTRPTYFTIALAIQATNLFVFSITIIGSLIGYLYGVVSIFWGKESVRNVDFTVTGWLVNANCYGPLLGIAIWGMFPDLFGTRPGIVDGPLHYASIWSGLLLNVLYSLSIFNMWTKFGVMVDKGICRNLMFGVVRHPCYSLEGVMFAIMSLHHIPNLMTFVSIGVYSFLYWIRSERDEDFMLASNADYAAYREQVVYKYLPGLV
ncbi:MAG: hypothetical protein QM784_24135 [Polyangiaceae bacterium]